MTTEEYFLGQCLWDPAILWNTKVTPSDFAKSRNKQIFETMLSITRDGEVVNEMLLSQRTGFSLGDMMSLKDSNILAANWKFYDNQIRQSSAIRKLKQVAKEISDSQGNSPEELIAMMQKAIDSQKSAQENYEIITIQESVTTSLKLISDRIANGSQLIGIPSGIVDLDRMTLGFQSRRLYYIGARPTQGKSAFLVNCIRKCNAICGVLSAESAHEEITVRLLAGSSMIDSQRMVVGLLKSGEVEQLNIAATGLYNDKKIFMYDEANMRIDTAVMMAREMKRRFDIQILFVDYLQLLDPPQGNNKQEYREHIAYVSKQMKQLARSLNIPVVVAAQLRRDAEGKEPLLSDFSDSTQIERDADVAIMIHNEYTNGNLERSWLLIEKNRDGRTGKIPVVFDKPHIDFSD